MYKDIFKVMLVLLGFCGVATAQVPNGRQLDGKQQKIVSISALTAVGNWNKLEPELNAGLDAGLTINAIKEVLVHLYAYCGFPKSISAFNSFISVIEARRVKGITDVRGKAASPINDSLSKYPRGKKILEKLVGQPEQERKTGYAAFSPEIDVFLKEHLFADIFERDVLTYQQRELATISALCSMGNVEPMLKGHFIIGLNTGITKEELKKIISQIEKTTGKKEADAATRVLNDI